ncbi:MAG: ArsR family transcriptional regulator [Pyrobaculum sp.]
MERAIYGASIGRRRDLVLLLHKEGPLTLTKIRDKLRLSVSMLLFEVSALESLGVVKREDNVVYLTELGKRAASVISTIEPFRSLNFLSLIGLRPFVVWLLMSPYIYIVASVLIATWVITLLLGSLHNPPLTLLGVAYVGYYLPYSIKLSPFHSFIISTASIAIILAMAYVLAKITPHKAAIGVTPLVIYPALHLTLVQITQVVNMVELVTVSQILLFISLLLTAAVFATVYSFEMGISYENSLVRTLLIFFIIPALLYLLPTSSVSR